MGCGCCFLFGVYFYYSIMEFIFRDFEIDFYLLTQRKEWRSKSVIRWGWVGGTFSCYICICGFWRTQRPRLSFSSIYSLHSFHFSFSESKQKLTADNEGRKNPYVNLHCSYQKFGSKLLNKSNSLKNTFCLTCEGEKWSLMLSMSKFTSRLTIK